MSDFIVEKLSKSVGDKTVFKDISFIIHDLDRIGLIGVNGTGKTTLLDVLSGVSGFDGDVSPFSAKNDYQIGYLTQDPDFDDSKTVLDTVLSSDLKEIQLIREYELIMLNYSEDKQARLERVMAEMDSLQAWEIERQAYDYLPDMAASQDKLNRLFDLETDFTFESSEQAWAALLWALEIENVQPFLKAWKTSRQFAKQVQNLLTILALREKGELSKRDCYRFDLDLILQAENLRQAQGKPVNPQVIIETYQSLTIHDKKEIQINGGILIKEYGFQPGPDLGEILTEIEYAIVDGELENDRQTIHAYLREKK